MSGEEVEGTSAEAQMDVITGKPDMVELDNGTEVTVYKCKVRQIGAITSLISSVLGELGYTDPESDVVQEELAKRANDPTFLLQLIANNVGDMMSIAANLCSLSSEEFDDLSLEDAYTVVEKEVELNKDFFLNRILPMVKGGRAVS